MRLSYTRSGNPDSAAILFLHGMAMGQWMWHDQIQHFADYDCYNVDLPGHGGSSAIEWDSFDQAASLVAQLITEEIPDKPVYLVGMSLGAVVGLHLLICLPARIERAVFTGAIADTPPRWLVLVQAKILSAILPTKWGKQLFARMLQLPSDVMPYYEQSINALSIPAFRQMTRQVADYSPPVGLRAIRVPSLFVTGEKDISFNRRSVTLLARQVPQSVGVFAPGVHHGWNGEDPALFNEMTRAWIEGQPLPQRLIKTA
ncbi:MAG: alpha/beta hydrolase [Chitinophagaceae bacterium]|nr:alpha/beta hydrolase [Anaerolineae bacterium]